jgi:hypothetical protein
LERQATAKREGARSGNRSDIFKRLASGNSGRAMRSPRMAATHAIAKMLIHHSTCCALEVGWGSNTEAANADTMDSAMGMANVAAETRKLARE